MNDNADTVTLFRPVGQKELDLIAVSGYREFPPRLSFQSIFYPVLNEEYAMEIARDWNTKDMVCYTLTVRLNGSSYRVAHAALALGGRQLSHPRRSP